MLSSVRAARRRSAGDPGSTRARVRTNLRPKTGREEGTVEFGIFDHVDRGAEPLDEYFENRMKVVEAFDRGGFYSYHVAEHHATPLGMAASPSVYFAAVAQRTRRLRFGPMVFALPLHHPIRLVEEICMIDQMSRGRLELGFGRGASPIETRYFGPDPAEAQQMYVEGLDLVLKALAAGKVDFQGAYYKFDNVPLAMEPYQRPHPPLWYGMHSPDSAERAARRFMNVISLDTPAETRAMADRYRATWAEVGGGKPCPRIGLSTFIVVGDTDRAAQDAAARAYETWHTSFNYPVRAARHAAEPAAPAQVRRDDRDAPRHRRHACHRDRRAARLSRGIGRRLHDRPVRVRRPYAGRDAALDRAVRRAGDARAARLGRRPGRPRRHGPRGGVGNFAPVIRAPRSTKRWAAGPGAVPARPADGQRLASGGAAGIVARHSPKAYKSENRQRRQP